MISFKTLSALNASYCIKIKGAAQRSLLLYPCLLRFNSVFSHRIYLFINFVGLWGKYLIHYCGIVLIMNMTSRRWVPFNLSCFSYGNPSLKAFDAAALQETKHLGSKIHH